MIYDYRDLEVYQEAFKLALQVHQLTLGFPKYETYEMGQQMRTASKRVASCIAEGFGKKDSEAEFKRFVAMAHGSVQEMKVWLEFAVALGYGKERDLQRMWQAYDRLGKRLHKLRATWQKF